MPCKITKSIEDHLKPFGELKYPLSHVKIVDIDNEFLKISQARVGGNKMKVKFKKNIEDMKRLFDIHLASFVEVEMGFEIDMED